MGTSIRPKWKSILLPNGKVYFSQCVRKGRRRSPIARLHAQPREATAPVHDNFAGAGRSLAPHLNQNGIFLGRKY